MDELLQKIAEEKGYPAELVGRSAAARAQASGISTDDVLRSWAGVGDAPAAAAASPTPSASAEPPSAVETPDVEESGDGPKVEVLAPAIAEADEPAGETEPAEESDEAVPALAGFPRWLAVAFVVLPALALLYVMVLPSGPQCGNAGALAIDPSTGVAENCDGSEYGSDPTDPFAIGASLYDARCAVCHGAAGGGGAGPAFTNGAVIATFSSCTDHIEWVNLGSADWPDLTYGDSATPVAGGMPGFSDLSLEDLGAIALYERVAFGGEDRAAAETSCLLESGVAAAP